MRKRIDQDWRAALLASHPWSFATTQAALPRLAQSPSAEFRYAFQLPPDFLRAISAGTAGRATGLLYRIQGSKLMTDVETVALTHIFRPDESSFPPFFAAALLARLAAEFCLPLTENTSRAELLARLGALDSDLRRTAEALRSAAEVQRAVFVAPPAAEPAAASAVAPAARSPRRAAAC